MDAWAKLLDIFLVVEAEQVAFIEITDEGALSQLSLFFFFLSEEVMLLVTREVLFAFC